MFMAYGRGVLVAVFDGVITMRKFLSLVGTVCTLSLVSVSSFAATSTPLDTADAVAQIGEINTAVAAVGGALVAAAAIAVGFKWLKGAIFS